MNAIAAEERSQGTGSKIASVMRELFTNWRLALLGITGLILSLASGWTTWDGMSNFTCPTGKNAGFCLAPRVLSFMVTFGIQGIMLIAAWLIGETFAANNSAQRTARSGWFKGGLIAAASVAALVVFVAVLTQDRYGVFDSQSVLGGIDWASYRPGVGTSSLIIGVIALFLILSRREIAGPYINGAMTVLRNIPLWIMFLSCMATSVFFSFDSLFSTIFPQNERVRAAKLRVENQVAGVMSDVQAQLGLRRLEATRSMFASQQWRAFNNNLDQLVAQAASAPDAVQKQKLERLSQSRNAQAEVRGLISTSEATRRTLEAEKARLDGEIKDVAERRAPAKEQVALIEEQLVAKRAEIVTAQTAAEGERQGVRGTGNAGAGPEFRRLRKVVQNLELDSDELNTKLKTAQGRASRLNDEESGKRARIAEIGREMIALEEKIKEAGDRKAVLDQSGQNTIASDLDAAGGIKALDVARNKFRREPVEAGLDQLEQLCTSLLANLRSVASLKTATASVNCEPGDASVLANNIFRLRKAEATFRVACTSGDKMPRGSANKLLNFGSVCIQDSGLRGADTEQFRTQLNRIALNRDDKAHRFVVSWNAFNDGNALAYLALAIAIAIDGLVFMSGLFGANVVRSPLSSISAERLVATIDKALGSDKYAAARKALEAIADKPGAGFGSFRHQVTGLTAEKDAQVKNVLIAGMGLNAVRWDEINNRFLVHADFTSYLNQVANRTVEDASELQKVLANALAPEIRLNAESVMREIVPVSSEDGFMGYVKKTSSTLDGDAAGVGVLQRALSAGTSMGVVQTSEIKKIRENEEKMSDDAGGNTVTYWIRRPFWTCLAHLHATHSSSVWRTRGSGAGGKSGIAVSDRLGVPLPPKVMSEPPAASEPVGAIEQAPGVRLVTNNTQVAPAPPQPVVATVAHEEQNRRSMIENDVRAALVATFELDDVAAKRLLDDATSAVDTLNNLKRQQGVVSNSLVPQIERTVNDLRSHTDRIVRGYDQEERLIAEEERDVIVLAEAGRRASYTWRQVATDILEQIDDAVEVATHDGAMPNRNPDLDAELRNLRDQISRLQSHDRFDRNLASLVSDADRAWQQLSNMRDENGFGPNLTRTYQ